VVGALVSAQQPDADGNPVVYAATVTEIDGRYALFLNPDRDENGEDDLYTIVAYKKEYDAGCAEVITFPGMNQDPDPDATDATDLALTGGYLTGTVGGAVTIDNGAEDQYVTVSFRQAKQCGSTDALTIIEVKAENYVNGEPYLAELSEGTYDLNASTYNPDTDRLTTDEIAGVTIANGVPKTWNIVLPPLVP
jgi:hypothetical protein